MFLYPVTDPTGPPLCKPGPVSLEGWRFWLATHPDRIYQETILSIILRGAKLGYYGPKQKIISGNLPPATNDPGTLTADLKNQIAEGRFTEVSQIRDHFICSNLGLAPKPNGKWRRIHYRSYPRGRSVKEWGALK